MAGKDFNDILLENAESHSTLCSNCNQNACLKYIKIEDIKPAITLVVFECKNCNTKETSIFNDTVNPNKMVIECNFCDKEDIKREVNLNMKTNVYIKYEDLEFEYESNQPEVTTVEGIIYKALEDIGSEKSSVVGEKDKIADFLSKLEKVRETFRFYMRITDLEGLSRVCRIGRTIFEMQNNPIEDFNDDRVKHIFEE